MTIALALLGILVIIMAWIIFRATGRNRTPGDRLTGPDWFDLDHDSNRASNRRRG